jgi:hypothetical protein
VQIGDGAGGQCELGTEANSTRTTALLLRCNMQSRRMLDLLPVELAKSSERTAEARR